MRQAEKGHYHPTEPWQRRVKWQQRFTNTAMCCCDSGIRGKAAVARSCKVAAREDEASQNEKKQRLVKCFTTALKSRPWKHHPCWAFKYAQPYSFQQTSETLQVQAKNTDPDMRWLFCMVTSAALRRRKAEAKGKTEHNIHVPKCWVCMGYYGLTLLLFIWDCSTSASRTDHRF